jgi:Ca2+:H+ antiporter
MNGNVALSMEIGSSYALQVILLQTPCLVLFSAFYGPGFWPPRDLIDHVFLMIFPQWDMITVILAVFLMGWIVNEGKSNYFKGSILIFTYLVVVVGFWFSGYGDAEVSSFLFFSFPLLGVFPMIVLVDFTDGAFFR